MRLAFLVLLLANLALFAWQRGILGPLIEAGREPQRLAHQLAPEKLRTLTPEQLSALRGTLSSADSGAARACLELGDFDDAALNRVQARLAPLALGDRLLARRVEAPGWFVVYLPPAGSRAEAERLAQDLRLRGIRDLVVMGENSPMPLAILLGSFRDPELAQRHHADLLRRGFRNVMLSERAGDVAVTRFEVRQVDPALAQQLAEIQREFPQSRLGACDR